MVDNYVRVATASQPWVVHGTTKASENHIITYLKKLSNYS